MIDVVNRLAKWRGFFAGWQLGTRTLEDPEAAAVRDHRELSMMLRVEVTALAAVLIAKGVITVDEWAKAVEHEAWQLDRAYRKRFPGFSTDDDGLHMKLPEARETMRRMNFKP